MQHFPGGGTDHVGAPRFVAYSGVDDYVQASDSLTELLDALRELASPDAPEDVVVMEDDLRIAAVVLADGTVHRFDKRPAPASTNGLAKAKIKEMRT